MRRFHFLALIRWLGHFVWGILPLQTSAVKGFEGGIPPSLFRSGCGASGNLVGGGIRDFAGLHIRCSIDHFHQFSQHLGISRAIVAFRLFLLIPHADSYSFRSAGCKEGYFITESLLFAEYGKDSRLNRMSEFSPAVGL